MFITARSNVDEVAIHAKLHQRSKPMKCVRGDSRCRLNCSFQLVEVGVEYNIRLPLLVDVTGVPWCTKLRSQWFKRFDLRESGSL
jgi:hypothetical protein